MIRGIVKNCFSFFIINVIELFSKQMMKFERKPFYYYSLCPYLFVTAPAHEIQESNVFMDALQQSSSYASLGMKKKKKAASPSVTTPPVLLRGGSSVALSSSSTPTASATSPPLQGIDAAISVSEPGPTSPPLLSPTTAMAQKLPSVPSVSFFFCGFVIYRAENSPSKGRFPPNLSFPSA